MTPTTRPWETTWRSCGPARPPSPRRGCPGPPHPARDRGHRLCPRAPARARRHLGEYTSWRTALTLRPARPSTGASSAHASTTATRASTSRRPGGRFINPNDEDEKRRVVFLGERDGEGHLRRPRIRSARRSSSTTRRTRSSASCSANASGDLRRAGQEPRRHPPVHLQGRLRTTPRINVVVFRVHHERRDAGGAQAIQRSARPAARLRPRRPARLGLWDTVKGQKIRARSCSASRSSSASSAR